MHGCVWTALGVSPYLPPWDRVSLLSVAAHNILAGSRLSREPRHGLLCLAFPGCQDSDSGLHRGQQVLSTEHWTAPSSCHSFPPVSYLRMGMSVLLRSSSTPWLTETTSSHTQVSDTAFHFIITIGQSHWIPLAKKNSIHVSIRHIFIFVYILPKCKNLTFSTPPNLCCTVMFIFMGLKVLKMLLFPISWGKFYKFSFDALITLRFSSFVSY